MRISGVSTIVMIGLGLTLWTAGCGGSESTSEGERVTPSDSKGGTAIAKTAALDPSVATPDKSEAVAIAVPMPDVAGNAPVLGDMYPALTDGALRHARLVELSSGIIFQAEGAVVSQADLKTEIEQVPMQMREQMRENAFFILEQMATRDLLTLLARKRVDDAAALDEEQLLQRYFENLTGTASVTDAEIRAFNDDNRGLAGNASLDQMRDRIRQHLLQEKQQRLVEEHIAELGSEMTVAVSADWIKEQAPRVLNNPVDKARGNGKPTFVNFGARGCRPCDMMEPVREKLAEEYEGQVDVVYVNVQEHQMLASRYGVRSIPHLVFFDENGDIVHTHTGFMPEEQIREWLKKNGVKGT